MIYNLKFPKKDTAIVTVILTKNSVGTMVLKKIDDVLSLVDNLRRKALHE